MFQHGRMSLYSEDMEETWKHGKHLPELGQSLGLVEPPGLNRDQ
jgi:hypothetical protein